MTFEEYWREWWGDSWKDGAPVSEWSSGSIEQSRIACEEAWEARVPEGYVLVPVEPTTAMEEAFLDIYERRGWFMRGYKNMIKAAQEKSNV